MGLKELRKRTGLTAKEVGNKLGVSFQSVYNWEANSCRPHAQKLIELSKLYNCTLDELLADDLCKN